MDAYHQARRRLTGFLLGYSLVQSHEQFQAHDTPYPYAAPDHILAANNGSLPEQTHQNTALIFLLDGALPRRLNKHFRLRGSNRIGWRNLQRLAPHVDLSHYKATHARLDMPEIEPLLAQLCPLDYALMIERLPPENGALAEDTFEITHMHVKIERLTDNSIKELGKELGYIDRSLFERGEDYVDALEAKFYEYYGFAHHASGRKSAAATAAQILARLKSRFAVFVASQEDGRITLLDESPLVTQYMLIRPDAATFERLRHEIGADTLAQLALAPGPEPVLVYRVRFRRTRVAQPGGHNREPGLKSPWLEIAEEALVVPPNRAFLEVPVTFARSGA